MLLRKSAMRMSRILKIGLITLSVIVFLLAGLLLFGWINSPGKTHPITDPQGNAVPGSIASLEKIPLGGTDQWILMRGQDTTKPVLLFLHGGPGSPEMPFIRAFNPELEEHFVVVNWDQRGSGKSYSEAIPDSTFTIRHFVDDTHELANWLRRRFNQDKIYLMGHSWGSALGVLAVQQNPEPFQAYIGIGQVVNMQEGERISYDFVRNTAQQTNNQKALQELERIGPPPYLADDWLDRQLKEREWVTAFGGSWYGTDNTLTIARPLLAAREYTLSEKANYLKGALRTLQLMWPEVMQINLLEQAPRLEVPVYIFQGEHDYQTPHALARQYYEQLQAPRKQFFTFPNTAHSPNYEQPQQFIRLLLDEVLSDTQQPERLTSGQ
jgi:pimeloyl-ACP methyl ester carboxylesterase